VPLFYWDDFKPGQTIDCGSLVITRDEIVAFATQYDPQTMHLDEEAARSTMVGGLIASGWHSCCILVRMVTECLRRDTSVTDLSGIEETRWLAPIRPGDRIAARATVLDSAASSDDPDRGLVRLRLELLDVSGKALLSMRASPAFARRDAAAARAKAKASSAP
jgi:acyl dehydratase